MKLIRKLFLFIAVIFLTTSCSHTNEQLLQAEALIETAPDSAMTILNKYNYNKLSDKDKALYGLVYMQVRDKKFLSLEPDSLLSFAINYYNSEQEKTRLSDCYLLIGKKFKSKYQYEEAMNYFINVSELKNDNYKLLGNTYINMADIHSFQSDFDIARLKYTKAYKYFQLAKMKQQSFYAQLFIGKTYSLEGQYLKADRYYKRLKNQIYDSVLIGTLYQEIGQNFYKNVQYDSALSYLDRVKDYPYIGLNRAIRLSYLSKVYFELRKYDSAFYYANEIFKYQSEIRLQRESYRIMTNCEFINGRTKNVTKYMNKYVELGDSIYKLDKQIKGSYIETMHNTQKDAEKSRSWIWYISVLAILIIVLAILFYIRKHRKGMQTIKTIEEKQLVKKKESVQEIVERTKEALHKSLKEKRIELTKKIKQNSPEGRREMILQLYDESVHFKNKQHFKNEMDNTLNNLYSKLETSYPKLKTKEKQWACLNMLDIPKDDCIQLLDFNTESFKKMRQRFAQKIGVDTVTNIDAVLKKILYDAT